MSLIETIKLPDLGEVEEVEVIEISVEPGQKVSADDSILVLETDKAAMEIPASKDGVVKSILLNVGDKAETGMPFLEIETSDEGLNESKSIVEADEDVKQEVEVTESNEEIAEQAKSQLETIKLPDLGEVEEVEVIEISVEPGQKVSADDSILVLETDKAAMEIPASKDGVVKSILLNVGDKAETGMPFLEIEAISISHSSKIEKENETKIDAANKETKTANSNAKKSQPYPQNNTVPKSNSKTHAGPATRKLAREFGIDLNKVIGSGPKNRIIKEDLHAFVANALNNPQPNNGEFIFNQPDIDYKKWGDIEEKPLSKFQKTALKNLHTSWINIPHVTQHDEADITELLKLRSSLNKKHKLKISPLAYIAKVIANVLIDFPEFNTSLSADLQKIIYKEYINIGIAVDTPDGLIVPNIKNSDKKSIKEISNEIFELASLAKDRKLKVVDLKGATLQYLH
jgi:pyruvate dehydrogenase E2 component (dihydrolipoamide acetyltransferase)